MHRNPWRSTYWLPAIILLLLAPTPVLSQGRVRIHVESRAIDVAKEKDHIRIDHPWLTDGQIQQAEQGFLTPRLVIPRPSVFDDPNARPKAPLKLPTLSPSEIESLLSTKVAKGWGYLGADPKPANGLGTELHLFDAADKAGVDKFYLVNHPFSLSEELMRANTIQVPLGEILSKEDLKGLFDVNNRVLDDLLKSTPRADAQSDAQEISVSNSMKISGARRSGGKELLTIFGGEDAGGPMHGEVYSNSYKVENGTPEPGLDVVLKNRLSKMPPGRIYYYGDPLESVKLGDLASDFGHELIFRTPSPAQDFFNTDRRLQEIAERPIEKEQLTIVNGLPQDAAAVEAMGVLSGSPADWLKFRRDVDAAIGQRAARHLNSHQEFFQELSKGQSDVVILIAHATGTQLYLNGQKISFKEIQELPLRANRSPRPRLGILLSCDAGAPNPERHGFPWVRRMFTPEDREELSSLAQILVQKGFFDKVIGPDHKIQPEESLTVLQKAFMGERTQNIFPGWIPWAVEWLRAHTPLG